MYKETLYEHKQMLMNEHIESEMQKVREKAIHKLNLYRLHPSVSVSALLLTIAYGYSENYAPAETIANELDLGKLEFMAIAEDVEAFKEAYLKDLELTRDF